MTDRTPTMDEERKPNSLTTAKKTKRPTNPYTIKASEMVQIRITDFPAFVQMVNVHVNTILQHDPGQKSTDWYGLWQQWLDDELLEATTRHMVSVIIEFPPNKTKTNKAVARFLLEQLPVLDRYLKITGATREEDPLVDIREPYIIDTPTVTAPIKNTSPNYHENNPYALLDDLNEEATAVDEMNTSLGPPIEEMDTDDIQNIDTAIEQLELPPNESPTETSIQTQDIIQNIHQDALNFATSIDNVNDSHPSDNSYDSISKFWDTKQREFETYMTIKHMDIDTKIANYGAACEASKHSFNKELLNMKNKFQTKTDDSIKLINTTSATQQKIVHDISQSTIEQCTTMFTKFKTETQQKHEGYITSLATKIHEAEAMTIANNKREWKDLHNKMTTTYTQLVSTNAIAIKNNKLLTTKLAASTTDIESVDDTIALQQSTIQGIQLTLSDIDTRLKQVTDVTKPTHDELIKNKSQQLLHKIIEEHWAAPNTITIVEDLFDETIDRYADNKIAKLITQSCEIIQDKANAITATFDVRMNKVSNSSEDVTQLEIPIDAQPTLFTNVMKRVPEAQTMPQGRNPLFPNVDPSMISMPTHTQLQSDATGTEVPRLHDNEYLYNSNRHFININSFYKLKWNNQCNSEADIFTFYESLQHMASTCGIPMNNLEEIDETTGICPLTSKNCLNYDKAYKLMKGAIFYKINDPKLWTGYSQGWNLVKANLLHCDGFEVLLDVLSEVLPKLNVNNPKSHKITRPVYNSRDDDNLYSYINEYNTFTKFEGLENNSRSYTPYETAVYIADDIEHDPHKRFDKGIDHIRLQLKHSTDGISVPKDIGITKIAKTICKYCPDYTIGEYNNVADDTSITPTIHMFNNQNNSQRRQNNTTPSSTKQFNRRPPKDMSIKCKFCGQLGHDGTNDQGCIVFAKWTMCQQASQRMPPEEIKANTRKFLKNIRQQQSDSRQRNHLDKRIKTLQDQGANIDHTALIHSLQLIADDPGYTTDSDSDSDA